MLYQNNYLVVSVKLNISQRQPHCTDDQDKFQSITDTDNGLTECQTPRKQLQSIGISPGSVHSFIKTLKSNISEAYKAQVACLKDSKSDFYNKTDMKEKVNDLVRLHKVMQEKLKTALYSEQIQILTFVHACTVQNILMSLNTLFELHIKSKQQAKYQQNLLKIVKTVTTETLLLVTNVYEDDNFSRQVHERKDYVSVSNGVREQKLLCNFQELYTAFKEKHTNASIGFSKFCPLKPKWCVLVGSKMTRSVCFCSTHQNVVLLVDTVDWDLIYKDLIKLTLSFLKSSR